jgi:hypothetical protein
MKKFRPEDGGDKFLRNICNHLQYHNLRRRPTILTEGVCHYPQRRVTILIRLFGSGNYMYYYLDDRCSIPTEAKAISSNLCVQTGSGTHPASYPRVLRSFPYGKARPGRDADHSPHLVPRSRMSTSYTSSPLGAYMAVAGQLYFYVLLLNVGVNKRSESVRN